MSNFHKGELAVHELADVHWHSSADGMFHSAMPPSAARFVEERNLAAMTWHDDRDRLWVTPLSGQAGFLQVLDARTISMDLDVGLAPCAGAYDFAGDKVALVLLDFAGRRRMRVNGTARSENRALVISIEQTYGNCPKYIQSRIPADTLHSGKDNAASDSVEQDALDSRMQTLINKSDTFFIGTYAAVDDGGGADASHRGGNPGFVKADEHTVRWNDFPGNNMFNTLGNIQVDPRTALLFLDFETGEGLAVSGEVESFTPSAEGKPAAKETVLKVHRARFFTHALAQSWKFLDYSPFNDRMAK